MNPINQLIPTVSEDTEIIDLGFLEERNDQTPSTSRKFVYKTGETNYVDVPVGDEIVKTWVRFDKARLIRVALRPQNTKKDRRLGVANLHIVLDGLRAGWVDAEGEEHLHPVFTDPRLVNLANLAWRIEGQQWMAIEDAPKLVDFANWVHQSFVDKDGNNEFRIDVRPEPREGRKTRDVFRLRPAKPFDKDNPTTYGVPIQAFEVSVNYNYGDGFRSFVQGLTEQMERVLTASSIQGDDLRKKMLDALRNNAHFVGGVYQDPNTQQYWGRPVDIGAITVDNKHFPFYDTKGPSLDSDEVKSLLDENSDKPEEIAKGPQIAPTLSVEDLIDDGPDPF